jgi:hypothetical protein
LQPSDQFRGNPFNYGPKLQDLIRCLAMTGQAQMRHKMSFPASSRIVLDP